MISPLNSKKLPRKVFSKKQIAQYNFFQFLDHFISRPLTNKLFGKWRYKAFLRVSETVKQNGEGRIIDVDRRTDLTEEEFKNYYVKYGIPVIMDGAAKNWECCQKWSPQYIMDQYGEDDVPLLDAFYLDQGVRYLKLKKIIEEVLKGNSSYLRFYNLLNRHPETHEDFDQQWLRKFKHKRSYVEFTQVFIGGASSMTGMHNSHADNLFVQIYGEKEWILYPNHYVPIIDPPSTTGGTYRIAPKRGKLGQPFNPFKPDFEDYPLFKYVDGYRVLLKSGDIFYNPPYMWHTVKNNTESIGLGFRWCNVASAFKSSPLYYFLDLCAYRPSYFVAYRWHRKDSNEEFIYAEKQYRKYLEKKKKVELKKKVV